jgi:catechol 2,3-dioxygenase-like lactoylglutathione lyase family enzyme
MNIVSIKETCIYSSRLEDMKSFYHDLIGLPIISEAANNYIFFRAGASVLLCFNPEHAAMKLSPPAHYGYGKLHFAFEVTSEDYQKTKEEIRSKGIHITDEVTWKGGMKSFYFEDPAGNVLEVVPEKGLWD